MCKGLEQFKGCLCEKIGLCRSESPDATCSSLLEDLDTCNIVN